MGARPIPLRHKMVEWLDAAINNDSLILSHCQVIDYSLLLIINTKEQWIRCALIDYVQQYTSAKMLESQIKKLRLAAMGMG